MSFETSPPPSRVRVPPPPPPGFGDEEYYRLYGRPEEYHRYRERLERDSRDNRNYSQDRPIPPVPPGYLHDGPPGRRPRRAPPPPGHDHEEYYYYRSYRRRSPRHGYEYEGPEFDRYSSNGVGGSKARQAPPPPPPQHRNAPEPSPLYESNSPTDYEEDMDELVSRRPETQNSNEGGRDFENFRVTIKNAHSRSRPNSDKPTHKRRGRSLDGTPSLSGMDEDELEDEDDEDSYYDDTCDDDTEDEESKKRRQRHRRSGAGDDNITDEKRSPSLPETIVRKKGSIKDRLGKRVPVRPPSPPDPPPKGQRIAPPLTPPTKSRVVPPRSPETELAKRPPSPLSPPPDDERDMGGESIDDDIEPEKYSTINRQDSDKRNSTSGTGTRIQNLASRKPTRQRTVANDSPQRKRSPCSRAGNKKNNRSWSEEPDNLGSRYGNRSPTPLPGTPRRVREQRAREEAAKKGKEKNSDKHKNSDKDKRKRNNPIYGKSKMRMDNESNKKNHSRDRSNDTIVEHKERPKNQTESLNDRKSRKEHSKKDDSYRSSGRDKTNDRNRSRTSSGGFGKGVIGINRKNRNNSGGNRPPTPVPIGSKTRNKSSRRNRDKLRAHPSENTEKSVKAKKQNTDKTTKENEIMLRRLARKRKGLPQSSESDRNHTLAKIAGIEIPTGTAGLESTTEGSSKKSRRDKSATGSDKSESDSQLSNEDDSGSRSASCSPVPRKNRKREWKSGIREKNSSKNSSKAQSTKKARGGLKERKSKAEISNSEKKECRSHSRSRSKGARSPLLPSSKKSGTSNEKWAHDKFQESLASPINDRPGSGHKADDRSDFGSHWQKIRSERSKERERAGRSRSASKSRSKRKKGRRSSSYSSGSSHDSRTNKHGRQRKRSRSHSRGSSYSSSRSPSTASSSSTGSIHRERRRERKKVNRKDRLQISAENTSVAQAATRASQAILSKQQGSNSANESQQATSSGNNEDLQKSSNAEATKDQVNMGLSGKLLEETNTVNGVVVKYSEPQEARKPRTRWRLYVFKGNEELPILYIHRQSAYLLGRDRKVADIPLDHPSCSKQHAALQYRLVDFSRPDGSKSRRVTPYVIDLNSANGTYVNNQKIESQKYVQLMEKDVLKFGFSSREYVMLHDQSKEEQEEDPGLE